MKDKTKHLKQKCEYCKRLFWKKHNCYMKKLSLLNQLKDKVVESTKPNKCENCYFWKTQECNGEDCIFEPKKDNGIEV